ncbi:MAG: TPM domain-containing protein [Candidatus Eisenbacteria bacterium]|nr:TPM domain-containing protein [Candidatus Eisenbacteria bacterium]
MKTGRTLETDGALRIDGPPPSRFSHPFGFSSLETGTRGLRLVTVFLLILGFLGPVCFLPAGSPSSLTGSMGGLVSALDSRPGVALAQEYPEPVGFVNDFAGVVNEEIRARIEAIAAEVKQKTGAEIVVVTVKTTGGIDIHDYAVELFTKWKIGKKGRDDGLLIVAATDDRKLWIKTGYGLEETIPDAVASQVYRNVLVPLFREGEYGRGLLSAVQVLAARIANQAGVTLTSLDGLPAVPEGNSSGKDARSFVPMAFVLGIMILLIIARTRGGPGSRRHGGFPFWTIGGFYGGTKGGGFGGGFGGFGGGSCGGGGAGGGW